ncbi:HAMP domain-containing histidine kinase [Gemmata obscuriglobus]|uniref:ATP-binding protein n=2 Tax=Gemmata obscuriglobus TaxID=114 RepID=A0A2Z3H2X5_9BACT|nr:HAMP domain-containing histidine kinase [Gemmata obscuriglobus]AWM41139.1 ATP-binding protein [Gemmata obscuriglobus]
MFAIPEALYKLAPVTLPSRRSERFNGAGYEVPLSRFAPADREILGRVYQSVNGLPQLWHPMRHDADYSVLEAYIRRVGGGGALLAEVGHLGEATLAAGASDPAIRKAVHDIRGGGLTLLLGTADLLDIMPGNRNVVRKCVDAARDHAKIMRNLLPDIDPVVRAADEATKAHTIDHFTSKWDGMATRGQTGPVLVSMRCLFTGAISARCLETSSIDRVVYNYVNNAVRFAAGGAVTVWIFPVTSGLTRWVVQNAIGADQEAFLAERVGDLGRLFAGGITRGGTGVGLANCAEIVADCFGLASPAEAVSRGYLGAATRAGDYFTWFHWPAYTPGAVHTAMAV